MKAKILTLTAAFLLLTICLCSNAAESQSAETKHILNIVIIELDTSPDAKLTEPVVNDWEYWDKCAGKLITRLESELGYKRAINGITETDGSLFAIRAAAKGLMDNVSLAPLIKELDHICAVSHRASFLVVWLPREGLVLLSLQDSRDHPAGVAFAMISYLPRGMPGCRLLSSVEDAYVVPPCLLVSRSIGMGQGSLKNTLSDLLDWKATHALLHCIQESDSQVITKAMALILSQATPAGTSIFQQNIDILTSAREGALASARTDNWAFKAIEASIYDFGAITNDALSGSTWRFNTNLGLGTSGFDYPSISGNMGLVGDMDLGGILLEPEILVVVDKSGVTSGLHEKAIAAVKGKTGGTFEHEGTQYTAVKTPRTAGIFQVPVGYFHLIHTDITAASGVNITPRLARCYDSANKEVSALGPGWSILPFLLKFDQRVEAKDGKNMVALKLVLIDRQAGAKLPYCLMKADSPMSQSDEEAVVAMYQKVSSSLQPDLVAHSDGGYRATFAHGFEVAFDKDGRIKWMGNSEVDRVEYVFNGNQLKEIRSNTSKKITLIYNEKGQLTGAKSTSGHLVTYTLDSSGRLKSVTGSDSGSFEFAYGSDGRLSTINANGGKQKPDMLIANTYDDKGRMLTQRTPQGQWEFAYNDDIGRVITTDPMGRQTTYFYDAHQRLVAYGTFKGQMTLFNYDMTGRILQVAVAKMLNNPSKTERPKFKISEKVFPSPSRKEEKTEG